MKKTLLLATLLFQLTLVFGQTVGTTVLNKTIYNSSGIVISYSIIYYGVGDCHNNTNGGLKKYKIDFNARNTSTSTVKFAGSRIDLDDNLDRYKYDCYSSEAIFLGNYPGFEDFGTLVPNENVNATKYVYMLENTSELPHVSYNVIPQIIQQDKQAQKTANSNSNQNTSNSQNNYNNQFIEQALSEFNQLLPNVPSGTTKTNIYNNVQNVLNGNYSEQGKLNVINDGIYKFKNLIAQSTNSNKTVSGIQSNTPTTQQNDLTEYNRSKADLERQMNEKNAQGQQKSQNYTTAMNAGISAYNSGNYSEAKNQFSIALNNCNTEEARAKAQEYYTKSVDAEKSQAKMKMTGDLVQSGINTIYGIADAVKASKELKEEKEKEDKLLLEKIKSEKLTKELKDYEKNKLQIDESNKKSKEFKIYISEKIIPDNVTPQLIINNHIKAIGGIEKLMEVQFTTINEVYIRSNVKKTIINGHSKYSENIKNEKGETTYKIVFDGKKGYRKSYDTKYILRKDEIEKLKKTEPINILAIQKLNLSLLEGKVLKFNNIDCYALFYEEKRYGGKEIYVVTYFFDISSGLLVGQTDQSKSDPINMNYNVYEDYEKTNGILFYTKETNFSERDKTTIYINNGMIGENARIIKREISVNQNLTDKDFE